MHPDLTSKAQLVKPKTDRTFLILLKPGSHYDTWVRALLVHLLRFSSSFWSMPYKEGSLAATAIALSNSSTFLSKKQPSAILNRLDGKGEDNKGNRAFTTILLLQRS